MSEGLKFDAGKPELSLLPWDALAEIAIVQMYGAIKYDRDNWRKLDAPEQRYLNAAMRHLGAVSGGQEWDSESGLPHLAHAACNVVFALWFYCQRTGGGTPRARVAKALETAKRLRAERLTRT
jgi:hypothetical protein